MYALELRFRMKARILRFLCKTAVCALLLVIVTKPAEASIPTTNDIVWIGIAIGVIGAGIGIGIYFAVHHGHSLNGCAVSGPNGIQLQSKGDGRTYALVGDVAAIKPGERVRLSGKKAKNASVPPQFFAEKLNGSYGSCEVQSAVR
jgi:hypothetical protein